MKGGKGRDEGRGTYGGEGWCVGGEDKRFSKGLGRVSLTSARLNAMRRNGMMECTFDWPYEVLALPVGQRSSMFLRSTNISVALRRACYIDRQTTYLEIPIKLIKHHGHTTRIHQTLGTTVLTRLKYIPRSFNIDLEYRFSPLHRVPRRTKGTHANCVDYHCWLRFIEDFLQGLYIQDIGTNIAYTGRESGASERRRVDVDCGDGEAFGSEQSGDNSCA